jgi:SAM-dependent methyltransferase
MSLSFRHDLYQRYVSTFKGAEQAGGEGSEAWWDHKYLPLLSGVDRTASILELGCGAGGLLAYLKRRGFSHAAGIDISPEQVNLARSRGVEAELGDALEVLPGRPGHYAAVLAVDVLEHLTRDELLPLADAVYGSLQPGGRWLIQTANGAGLFPGQVIYGDLTHVTVFTPNSLAQLLRAASFGELRFMEAGPIPLRLRGRLNVALWSAIKLAANAVRGIETGKRQSIWTENFICVAHRS